MKHNGIGDGVNSGQCRANRYGPRGRKTGT